MKPFRVLLVSNVRPSRSWNFAHRITREVPGVTICGIVQRPLPSIPTIQRRIANREMREPFDSDGWLSEPRLSLRSVLQKLIGFLLWFVHEIGRASCRERV